MTKLNYLFVKYQTPTINKITVFFFFFFFSESPKDFKNIEISEENVRLDARPESAVGPSSCASSPTNSPARHSQHYRTLQSYSSPTRKLNIAVTPNHQRDVDQIHSKRWHTAPKEKHKVHVSCVPSYTVQFDCMYLTDCAFARLKESTLQHPRDRTAATSDSLQTFRCQTVLCVHLSSLSLSSFFFFSRSLLKTNKLD